MIQKAIGGMAQKNQWRVSWKRM